jgi:hypothetical protein
MKGFKTEQVLKKAGFEKKLNGNWEFCGDKTNSEAETITRADYDIEINNGLRWEFTLTKEPAELILDMIEVVFNEGQLSKGVDGIVRAIFFQHPELIEKYNYLPCFEVE